jgi:DNA-directed RNA polymerase specialized sigma24 family protein
MATADAFLALYVRDAERVLVFFTRRTLDVEVAVDLTPETFAQAWRGAASATAPTAGARSRTLQERWR